MSTAEIEQFLDGYRAAGRAGRPRDPLKRWYATRAGQRVHAPTPQDGAAPDPTEPEATNDYPGSPAWRRVRGDDAPAIAPDADRVTSAPAEANRGEATNGPAGNGSTTRLGTVNLGDVAPERVDWLWPGRIPRGKLTLLDGDPGTGKSTLLVDLAARCSTGGPMPDGTPTDDVSAVVIMSAEDGLADTIVPRLLAAGGDPSMVTAVTEVEYDTETGSRASRPPSLPDDVALLQQRVLELGARLVIVDVLNAYLSSRVNGHNDQAVRGALVPLARMAEQTGAAVVLVRHLNKGAGMKAIYRGGGSIGIAGAARVALLVADDPTDDTRQVLAVAKSNLAAKSPSLAYRIVGDESHNASRLEWLGHAEHTADDLLDDAGTRTAVDHAEHWLRDTLRPGPVASDVINQRATAAGISSRTLRRARERPGFHKGKVGMDGRWCWSLSEVGQP